MQDLLKNLLWIMFPPSCPACECTLLQAEACICTSCRQHLIRQTHQENDVLNLKIRAEIPAAGVYALFPFQQHGKLQRLLHALKYQHRPDIGKLLGQWLAEQLISLGWAETADIIIPVPLHQQKLRSRGYNQAAVIGQGLSRYLNKPMVAHALVRKKLTNTQTKKSRLGRWQNVSDAFSIRPGMEEKLEGKAVLLIDDVITTGATLESCAKTLHPYCKQLYLVALASA